VFGGILRDTRMARLGDAERVNHFPASPLVTVTLVFEGQLHLIPTGADFSAAANTPALPNVFVTRPCDTPISSWSPGPVMVLSIGFYHDAWVALGGSQTYDRLPPLIDQMIHKSIRAASPADAWADICAELAITWPDRRPQSASAINGVSDWVRSIAMRAAMSNAGKSIRSYERKLRRLSGQNARSLQFFSAMDSLHKIAVTDTTATPAQIAVDAGFADQSHMGRAINRATGFSPVKLNRAIEHDEAFWCYRLLGERF
jgi:AraC-like DNA-binding protein